MDYCPGNVVFRHGTPVALIDFDLARPTTRLLGLVGALYWWAPLLDPVDRPPSLVGADVAERVAVVADAYGLDEVQRAAVMPLALRRVANAHRSMRAAAAVDPVFARFWADGVKDWMPRAERWTAGAVDRVTTRLMDGPIR